MVFVVAVVQVFLAMIQELDGLLQQFSKVLFVFLNFVQQCFTVLYAFLVSMVQSLVSFLLQVFDDCCTFSQKRKLKNKNLKIGKGWVGSQHS